MRFFLLLFLFAFPSVVMADLNSEVAEGINMIRASQGLGRLQINQKLNGAARSQSDWMSSVRKMEHLREPARSFEEYKSCNYHPANRVVNSGYFSFDELFRPRYNNGGVVVDPLPAANECVGEIIAKGAGGGPDIYRPDIILRGWMNSPGHRRCILTPSFKEFGVGVSCVSGEVYWCVVFANR